MVVKLSIIKGMKLVNKLVMQGNSDLAYQVAMDLQHEIDCQDDKELVSAIMQELGGVVCIR